MNESNLLIIGILIMSCILIWRIYDSINQGKSTTISTEEYFINPDNLNKLDIKLNTNNSLKPNVYNPKVTENFNNMLESHKKNLININSELKKYNKKENFNNTRNHNLDVKMDKDGEIISTTISPSIYLN